jgi:broad specificity phosphatase PhoE
VAAQCAGLVFAGAGGRRVSRIVLVRHGETVWHAENRYAGSTEVDLTERGRVQAEALARWAARANIGYLYTSPMGRAQATARPVAAALGLRPIEDTRLRELHFGQGEGLTSEEMRQQFPEQYEAFRRNPVDDYLPGGEDPCAAIARGRAALEEIAAAAGLNARVLIVTHNTLIRLLLCDLLGIPLHRYRQVFPALENVSITELAMGREIPALLQFNSPIL